MALALLVSVAGCGAGDEEEPRYTDPAFSPDGARIAFVSNADGDFEVFVMSRDGSGVVRLTDNDVDDWCPAWSPDGARVAFVSEHGEGSSESGLDESFVAEELFVMSADGSRLRRLTKNALRDSCPSWSPDGENLVFARSAGLLSRSRLFTVDADGTDVHALVLPRRRDVDSDADLEADSPAWSPDGDEIAFVKGFVPQQISILRRDSTWSPGIYGPVDSPTSMSWSPDGTRIVFSSAHTPGAVHWSERPTFSEIYIVGTDGKGLRRLTRNQTFDGFPDWSPDGGAIVFISASQGVNRIWIMNVDGTGARLVTPADD